MSTAPRWHWTHDFVRGFGWRCQDDRVLYCDEAECLLGVKPLDPTDEALDMLWSRLVPLQHTVGELRDERWEKNPPRFDRIVLPRFSAAAMSQCPLLSLKETLS